MCPGVVECGGDEPPQALLGPDRRPGREHIPDLREVRCDHRLGQVVLAGEVVVGKPLRDTSRFGDLCHGGRLEAGLPEYPACRFDHARALFLVTKGHESPRFFSGDAPLMQGRNGVD